MPKFIGRGVDRTSGQPTVSRAIVGLDSQVSDRHFLKLHFLGALYWLDKL